MCIYMYIYMCIYIYIYKYRRDRSHRPWYGCRPRSLFLSFDSKGSFPMTRNNDALCGHHPDPASKRESRRLEGVFWSGWNFPAWCSGGRLSLQRLGVDSPVTHPAWDSNLRPPASESRPITN